jgi:MFS family permease
MAFKSLIKPETLVSFGCRGYPWLWLSISTNGYANVVSQIAIGWLALELTGSPLGVGIAVACRALPRVVLGVPFGALSDLYDRRVILQLTNFFGVAVAVAAIAVSAAGGLDFGIIVVIALSVGIFDVAETSVSRALVYDIVGAERALNGIALVTFADKLFGVLGALSAGFLLAEFGAVGAFVGMGTAYLMSGLALWGVHSPRKKGAPGSPTDKTPSSPFKNTFHGITQIGRNRPLSLLAGLAVTMEVLAFSSDVLLPSFARDILKVGETGLGTLTAVRSVGGVIGVLIIASLPATIRKGRLLLYACIAFGLGLIAFAHTPVMLLAITVMLFIGGMWASVDSLLPTLVQFCVGDDKRGAAVGVWNLSRGLGPLGHLEVGALGGLVGAAVAQTINGAAVILIVAAILLYSRGKDISFNQGRKKLDIQESSAPAIDRNPRL